jgi:hypothetical protein
VKVLLDENLAHGSAQVGNHQGNAAVPRYAVPALPLCVSQRVVCATDRSRYYFTDAYSVLPDLLHSGAVRPAEFTDFRRPAGNKPLHRFV